MTKPENGRRIPVKLHRQTALIRVNDPLLAEELLARKSLARRIVGRLSPTVLLVAPESETFVLEELRRMGHSPRPARGEGDSGP